jgi:hypothetical protein
LILCLAKSNLVFKVLNEVTVPDEKIPTWKILDELITLQLTEHNIHIRSPAELEDQEYFNLKWWLCIPG